MKNETRPISVPLNGRRDVEILYFQMSKITVFFFSCRMEVDSIRFSSGVCINVIFMSEVLNR